MIDSADFRTVLGHLPTGVTIVAAHDDEPVGVVIGTSVSISLGPPLVGFFIGGQSRTGVRIRRAGSFCINVLTTAQQSVCHGFATSSPDRFSSCEWSRTGTGAVRLEASLAWIDCELERVVPVGDHDLMVGAVRELGTRTEPEGVPLVFFRGSYCEVA